MLPVGGSKNYSHYYKFRHIICPLNKHRQNKHPFGMIFKIHVFEADINNNGISWNCYVKINTMSWNKGNNSFRFQHFFDKHMVFGCKLIEH